MQKCISLLLPEVWKLEKELAGTLIVLGGASFQILKGFSQKGEMSGLCYSLATLEKCPGSQSQQRIFGELET